MILAQVMFEFGKTQEAGLGIVVAVIAVVLILILGAKKK
jgi:hypothetical protein